MFGKKKKIIEVTVECPKLVNNRQIVSCTDCGFLIFRDEAQMIKTVDHLWGSIGDSIEYFCKHHTKKYTEVLKDNSGRTNYYKLIPAQKIKVDENGNPKE